MAKNVLFIMCDQLRWDYLSCYGHPTLETPHVDWLASQGVRFDRAYVQSPLCGPSRYSFLTGRYASSHGSMTNDDRPRPGEIHMGHYLQALKVRTAVVGKLAVRPNLAALDRLGIDFQSKIGRSLSTGGVEPFWHDDGLNPDEIVAFKGGLAYNDYLREQGYDTENPWDRNANSAVDDEGNYLSGTLMRYARLPANIKEEHSETAYTADQAIRFMTEAQGDRPWCLHMSFIKPHWPYVAPAPYNNMYGPDDLIPVVQDPAELENTHPVLGAFMAEEYSQNWRRQEVRETVIPTYMGLVKQIDDHLGRVLAFMRENRLMDDTLIVFTSDHGDYLGDHYLGEKYLFHEPSVRMPLIVVDPSPEADQTRGTVSEKLVESIDLLPTILDFVGGKIPIERIEGRSLLPLLRGEEVTGWRNEAISEIDYSDHDVRRTLNQPVYDCRAYMVRTERWKYILYEGYRPQLFDMKNDPFEVNDLGETADCEAVRREMHERLFRWMRRRKVRTETVYEDILPMGNEANEAIGVVIGRW